MNTPSKINLYLRVTGRRENGYHELETLFYPLSAPCDTVTLETDTAGQGGMIASVPGVPCDRSNLCMKALDAFCHAAGLDPAPFTVRLEKHIPVAAGMGGGSSDAAAVLRLMQQKYPGALTQKEVHGIAARLGADVPFFLQPVPSVATGIGENLTPVHGLPEKLPVLIAAPCFPVSAKWAYRNRIAVPDREQDQTELADLTAALKKEDYRTAAALMRNDLSAAVMKKFPLLQMLEKALLTTGALRVMVSGSGPTLFALYENFSARDHAADTFAMPNIRLM